MTLDPQIPTQHLLEVAFGVFNNSDMALIPEKDRRAKLQGMIIGSNIGCRYLELPTTPD